MRSMTGFGIGESPLLVEAGDAPSAIGRVTVEVRAVNHRFLDVRVRVPNELPDLAAVVEATARERLTRGRFDVAVRVEGAALSELGVDVARARSVFLALRSLRDELVPGAELPLSLIASVPDLFVPRVVPHGETFRRAIGSAFDAALRGLDDMRRREGAALGRDLLQRVATVRTLTAAIAERAPEVVEAQTRRLRDRAERLRASLDVEIDRGRLEQEIAIFADRVDVTEELTRLETHATHLEVLVASAEPVGRRLDFLLQELAREANTVGAKSQDVGIAHAVVDLKTEIERMREQVQNIE